MQPAMGPWRALRALVVAAACVGVSLIGHACAGGMLPTARSLAVAWSLLAVIAYLLSGRQWTFGRLLVVLGGAQAVLHPVFQHASAQMRVSGGAQDADVAMVLAHLVAAVVLGAVLARGEAALWRLLAAVRALLVPLSAFLPYARPALFVTVPPDVPRLLCAGSESLRRQLVPAEPRTTRGPPEARPAS